MSKQLTDVREMRKAIQRVARRGERLDGKEHAMSIAASIARNALCAAEYAGMSGEDAMTMLAYYLMLALEENGDRMLDMFNSMPPPKIVIEDIRK